MLKGLLHMAKIFLFKYIYFYIQWRDQGPDSNTYTQCPTLGKKFFDLEIQLIFLFRCLEGVTYSLKCSDGELFDMKAQECRKDDEVDCPSAPLATEKCWHQPDGFYPDYNTGCSSYYR